MTVRVCGDVREREVVPHERGREHRRGDERRGEAAVERVARGRGEPALVSPCGNPAGDERVDRQAEGDDERRAAEVGHQLGAEVYFEGHLVTMSVPCSRPSAYLPLTTTLRPTRNNGGGAAPW